MDDPIPIGGYRAQQPEYLPGNVKRNPAYVPPEPTPRENIAAFLRDVEKAIFPAAPTPVVKPTSGLPQVPLVTNAIEVAPAKIPIFALAANALKGVADAGPPRGFLAKQLIAGPAGLIFGFLIDPSPLGSGEEEAIARQEIATAAVATVPPVTPPMWAADP